MYVDLALTVCPAVACLFAGVIAVVDYLRFRNRCPVGLSRERLSYLFHVEFAVRRVLPVVSLVVNVYYWLRWILVMPAALVERAKWRRWILEAMKTSPVLALQKAAAVQKLFRWRADGSMDRKPWLLTLIARHFEDDSDGAAVLAEWAFGLAGYEMEIIYLHNHATYEMAAVAVSRDRTLLVVNARVCRIDPENWIEDMLNVAGRDYDELYPDYTGTMLPFDWAAAKIA